MTIIKVSRDGKAIVKKKEDETVIPLVRDLLIKFLQRHFHKSFCL